MILHILIVTIAVICLSAPSAAFLRTAPDISPFEYNYTRLGGGPNASAIVKWNVTNTIKSYWVAHWLHADNCHDYVIVSTMANAGSELLSGISLLDVQTGYNFGTQVKTPGQLSTTVLDGDSGLLHFSASTADQASELFAVSTFKEIPYKLHYTPKGPYLYQAGSGSYVWGTGYAYAFDAPETWVTGTLTINNTIVNIVPNESAAWFDMQWGPSYAPGGWHAFVFLLDNGVKVAIMVTNPTNIYSQNSIATILYPDGNHQVFAVDPELHAAKPWVSSTSNITYYSYYQLNIPGKGITLDVNLPWEAGETALDSNPTPANTIADSFAYYNGTFDGTIVRGYGIAEQRVSADGSLFGSK
ncbi:hypothetical protein BGW36DRAFT_355661 [Talaromyces proteolyticus]|uniref:AttH domain-containing protein n=1 Tax=Talaromyces proteolyticus TaxID=1131652 RepID=A0AAD4KUL1_9EURO|nr:uncharacterized protein BGW36DRAFT_355661 [Talaromyces proteolyticus]KAH8701502.1 hypothetical protein BGW36DRAFT_355661 [Talaromyces proteolyticus]